MLRNIYHDNKILTKETGIMLVHCKLDINANDTNGVLCSDEPPYLVRKCDNKYVRLVSVCGAKKPETPAAWNCECGAKNITSKFCPDCGKPKGDR